MRFLVLFRNCNNLVIRNNLKKSSRLFENILVLWTDSVYVYYVVVRSTALLELDNDHLDNSDDKNKDYSARDHHMSSHVDYYICEDNSE